MDLARIQEDNARAEQQAIDALAVARAQVLASPTSQKAKAAYRASRERLADVRQFNQAREEYAARHAA